MFGNGRANVSRESDRRISNNSPYVFRVVSPPSGLKRDSADNSDRRRRIFGRTDQRAQDGQDGLQDDPAAGPRTVFTESPLVHGQTWSRPFTFRSCATRAWLSKDPEDLSISQDRQRQRRPCEPYAPTQNCSAPGLEGSHRA